MEVTNGGTLLRGQVYGILSKNLQHSELEYPQPRVSEQPLSKELDGEMDNQRTEEKEEH